MMDQPGSPNMPAPQSYPSPSAAAVGDGAGPFFTHHQQRLPSPDELRLAAALSRPPQPNMAAAVQNGGPEGNMAIAPSLQHHGHHHQLLQHHHQADANLRASGSPVDHNHESAFAGDGSTPRKRSKVSRACDECRRKKIRCDATSESGMDQCSSCRRVGTRCQFSRVPMKRGPSKGYIKELADRLNTLENSMIPAQSPDMSYQPHDQAGHSPRPGDAFTTPSDMAGPSRKRTYSVVDDSPSTGYPSSLGARRPSLGGWPTSHDPHRHLPHPGSGFANPPQTPQSSASGGDFGATGGHRPQYSPNGPNHSVWKHSGREMNKMGDAIELSLADAAFDWNEGVLDRYYDTVHPLFPILPHSKTALRSRLASCSTSLREAFLEALAMVAPWGPSANSTASSDSLGRKAYNLLTASPGEGDAVRNMSSRLVHLQTMILMVLETEKRGAAARGGHVGPARAVWLGAAVGMAYDLRLPSIRTREGYQMSYVDSDEELGRRNWLALVMLDRWHAASTSSPVLVPDSSVVTVPEDRSLLGESRWHLMRVSLVLGHVAEVFVTVDLDEDKARSRVVFGRLLSGELERVRENVDAGSQSFVVVQLAYWHVKLLIQRLSPHPDPHQLLEVAQQMTGLLNSLSGSTNITTIVPLRHHFAGLAALTLVGLADLPDTKDEAWSTLQTLLHAIEQRRGLPADERPSGWDIAVRDVLLAKQDALSSSSGGGGGQSNNQSHRGGLQRLADLAVGEHGHGHHEQQAENHTNKNTGNDGGKNPHEKSSPKGSSSTNHVTTNASGTANNNNNEDTQRGDGNGPLTLDATDLIKEGYLSILLAHAAGSASSNHATAAAAITAAGLSTAASGHNAGNAPASTAGGPSTTTGAGATASSGGGNGIAASGPAS